MDILKDVDMRTFKSLSEQEILALAVSLEEEDGRIYDNFAQGLQADYPASAKLLDEMRAEEDGHRHRLIELYRRKFVKAAVRLLTDDEYWRERSLACRRRARLWDAPSIADQFLALVARAGTGSV